MAIPKSRLNFLIQALQNDAIEGPQGVSMFLGWQEQEQQRKAAIQQAMLEQQTAGLDALRENAVEWTTGDEVVPQDALVSRLSGLATTYGLPSIPQPIAAGLPGLYAGQNVELDEDDINNIVNYAFLNRDKLPRAQIRAHIREGLQAQLGPLYERVDRQVDQLVDEAYAGERLPEF